MARRQDFILSAAGEMTGDLATVRACWVINRLRDPVRDDHMLVGIAPPIVGQPFGLGNRDITDLILSARFEDSTLFPISDWPCHVYIARIVDASVAESLAFTKEQVEVIAWGSIFRTVEEAKK